MSLKTIRAGSMADALAQVKRDIGPDAVILRTRTLKAGGVMGLGARQVVEVTASHADDAPPVVRPRPSRRPAAQVEHKIVRPPAPEPAMAADAELPMRRSPGLDALVTPVEPNPQNQRARMALDEELSSIKKMVGELLHVTRTTTINGHDRPVAVAGDAGDALMGFYSTLVDAELAPSIADEVLDRARHELSPEERADPAIARETVRRLLGARLPVGDPGLRSPATGARIAFVGPTGVGKTTTIAKLAATFQLRQNKRVGLVTADTFRIAAVDQLRTYASIIGVPLKVAITPQEMASAIESMRDLDVILIDTAGRSPSDAPRLEELETFVRAAEPDITCLALSATSGERTLRRALDRFAPLNPNALALTKLDEAETLGPAINAAAGFERPVAILSTGQEVPDQFEWASRDRVVDRLIGEREEAAP